MIKTSALVSYPFQGYHVRVSTDQQGTGGLPRPSIEAIRRQTAAEVLSGANEIIHLTGVSHAEAMLSVLEKIQTHR